jgi:hypothetical protein
MMIAGKDSYGNIWPPPLISSDETDRELCDDIIYDDESNNKGGDMNKIALNAIGIITPTRRRRLLHRNNNNSTMSSSPPLASVSLNNNNNDETKTETTATNKSNTNNNKKQPKVLCMVYTMEQYHHTSIRVIRETWGGDCDGFLAFSTKDDPRIPSISIKHDGSEEYYNMVRTLMFSNYAVID